MRSFSDFEGKSVEKALQQACDEMNVPREKLKYDIISHGSSGIFGLVGTKKALIRVFTEPDTSGDQATSERSEDDVSRKEFKSTSGHPNKNTISALVDEAFGEVKAPEKKEVPAKKKALKEVPAKKEVSVKKEAPAKKEAPKEKKPATSEAAITVARELAQKIFDTLSMEVEMTVVNDSDQAWIKVKGAEPGILIGKRGQTLEAMQYLVDKVVNKQCGKGNRVIIDVEGYIESRKAELKELASRLAKKASRTGKPSTMSRMNAHDRRVVHIALKSNRLVRTQSVGEGYYRKLIIFPKKKASKKNNQESSN